MKKLLLILFVVAAYSIRSNAQNTWIPSGDEINAGVKKILPDQGSSYYIAGDFTAIGTNAIKGIAYWNGSSWATVGTTGITSGSTVDALCALNGKVYAGGSFTAMDSVSCSNIAVWDGSSWGPVGNGVQYTGATTVSTLAVYGGNVIAGGLFSSSGNNTLSNIAKWDGTEWTSLGSGMDGQVTCLAVYNNELYAGGTFTTAGGVSVNNLAKWNGTYWSDVGGGVQYTGATTVSTLQVWNGQLFVGGEFNVAGTTSVNNLAVWNGTSWSDPGGGMQYTGATTVSTVSLCVYGLKIAGEAKFIDNSTNEVMYYVHVWDGTDWQLLDSKTSQPKYCLESVNDTLYAAGEFGKIASDSINYLAAWKSSTGRLHTHIGSNSEVSGYHFSINPNPVTDVISIHTGTTEQINYSFSMSDEMGREAMNVKGLEGDQQLSRGRLLAGQYVYTIKDLKGIVIARGKLTVK